MTDKSKHVIVAILLCCLCMISCSPPKGTVDTSNTAANSVPFRTEATNTSTVSSLTAANLQTPVKARPISATNNSTMICTTQMPGVTHCVNPNANAYDRGELRRPNNGCGAGQGCSVSYGNDSGNRIGTGYGNGQGSGSGYGSGNVDPDPPPPPPKRKPKASSTNMGDQRCYSRQRDPSSNVALMGNDRILVCY